LSLAGGGDDPDLAHLPTFRATLRMQETLEPSAFVQPFLAFLGFFEIRPGGDFGEQTEAGLPGFSLASEILYQFLF
jgi:hypothetical protein